jgi:hypothetical protein
MRKKQGRREWRKRRRGRKGQKHSCAPLAPAMEQLVLGGQRAGVSWSLKGRRFT